MESTGHPCRLDFERFARRIGISDKRFTKILDKYMAIPYGTKALIGRSYLNDKMKRSYLRIITERTCRFTRISK